MKKITISTIAAAALLTVFTVSETHAIAGLGLHWGFDLSMSMKDTDRDGMAIPGMGFNLPDNGLGQIIDIPQFTGDFAYLSRHNWDRSVINFGGKAYIDIIPLIDAVELSCNIGVWQYDGAVYYLDVRDPSLTDPAALQSIVESGKYPYKKLPLTLKEYNMNYFGLNGTPFAKLHFDATVRKQILPLWLIKFSAGAGLSMHFATPLLNSSLVSDMRIDKDYTPEELVRDFANPNSGIGKEIVQKILNELFTPKYGAHLVVGAKLKLPVIPIGAYIDGKLMLPFSKFDEDKNISATGFLVNTGISLSF